MKSASFFVSLLALLALTPGLKGSAFADETALPGWDCAPITGKIPFSGTWVFTDGANFVAGELPTYGRTLGSLRITTWDYTGEWNGQSYSGLVSFRESNYFPGGSPRPYFAYPAGSGRPMGPFGRPGTVSLDGTITLSARALQEIQQAIESGLLRIPGVDRSAPDLSKVCASDMAMNVGRMNSGFGGIVRGGSIFLFLNDTRASYEMRF